MHGAQDGEYSYREEDESDEEVLSLHKELLTHPWDSVLTEQLSISECSSTAIIQSNRALKFQC